VKRLSLGFFLIGAASAVLLISDVSQRRADRGLLPRIAIMQHASQKIIDEGVQGMIAGLAGEGFADGQSVRIQRFNAEGDIATANAIAKEIAGGDFDLILTATTVSLQTVANANRESKIRHVFGLVSDPYGAGVGINADDHLDHPPYLTGIATLPPVRQAFVLARKLRPELKRVGVAWNPAEANSEANVRLARTVCRELSLELIEATVENSSGVPEAASSLVARGAEAIWVGADVAVVVAIDSVIAAARRGRIPVFTSIPGNAERGALFDLGANYFEVGRLVGRLAAKVLSGTSPAEIPVENALPQTLTVNRLALDPLAARWTISDEVAAGADVVIDARGTHKKAASATQARLAKKWRLHLIQLNNVLDVEEAERGILDGLREANLAEGQDYDIKIRNAQGDMATLNSLVDVALGEGADMLLTLSTPTLQAAIERARNRVPIVFTYVASAVHAGAGRSNEDHLPNVTGVPVVGAYPQMLSLLRECLPRARRIGTLYVPAEVNMVFNKGLLEEAAREAGLELVAMGVNTSSEVSDAALALMSKGIDALCQIPGNLTAASFAGIADAARRARAPVFAFQQVQAREGAVVTLARDYYDAGREAALMAARVMRGEPIASMPFQPFSKTKLLINPQAGRAVGLTVPPSILAKAAEVIGE
jgi:ABC-type uncharacterized transport system substrate-binding protein